MAVPKIVLFYKFTPLPDPEAIRLWQHTLASSLGLTGRILISEHGINGTVGGDIADVKKYVRGLRGYAAFKDTDIKWSDGTGDDFPRLSVKVRPEIVTFGVPDEVKVDENGIVDGGTHLSPHGVHELVAERGERWCSSTAATASRRRSAGSGMRSCRMSPRPAISSPSSTADATTISRTARWSPTAPVGCAVRCCRR